MENEREKMNRVYTEREMLADRYSLENPGNRFNFDRLFKGIEKFVRSNLGDIRTASYLDIGAGNLFNTERMIRLGFDPNNCIGSDLLLWRLKAGKKQNGDINAIACSATDLPFKSDSFDLVSQFTVLTSIPDKYLKKSIAIEIVRVLKPGGFVLWYDFRYNNPVNPNTIAIGLGEIRLLFENMEIRSQTITLLPQLARRLKGKSRGLLKYLNALPILRTHYLALIGPKK